VAWLCGIARNHALRRLGADRRVVPFGSEGEPGFDPASEQPSPLDDLTRAEGIEALRAAILALPIAFREAVLLCDLQELSYAAAAEALGCALGTVRSRLHRGRALLASALAAGRLGEPSPVDGSRGEPGPAMSPVKIRGLA
jgi:RNA polymerase sigma-70 factor (ECF subfamily)